MKTQLFRRFSLSLSEHRLCRLEGPEKVAGETSAKEKITKDTEAKLEGAKKLASLRAEVVKFREELQKGNKLEQDAKTKGAAVDAKTLEEQRAKEQTLLKNITEQIRTADPATVTTIVSELNLPGVTVDTVNAELLRLFEAPENRKALLDGMLRVQAGVLPSYLNGGDDGIFKLAQDMLGSRAGQVAREQLTKIGIRLPEDSTLRLIFSKLRGFFAGFLIKMPSAEMQERARPMHYRMVLEAHLRANRAAGTPEPSMTELVALDTPRLEERALGGDAKTRTEIRERWNKSWDAYRNSRNTPPARGTTNRDPGPPSIASVIKASDDASKKEKESKEKESKDTSEIAKERPEIQKSIEAYNKRASSVATLTLADGTTASGASIIAIPRGAYTQDQLVTWGARPAGTFERVAGSSNVRFNSLRSADATQIIEALTKIES
jgi:hypothetical protein